jgi:hypothetical protein
MTAVDPTHTPSLKDAVRDHWERETCGTRYGTSAERRLYFEEIEVPQPPNLGPSWC